MKDKATSPNGKFRRLPLSPNRQRLKCFASLDEGRGYARGGLEAADDYIDIQRIEFDATADAAGLLGCDEGWRGWRLSYRQDRNKVQYEALVLSRGLYGRAGITAAP